MLIMEDAKTKELLEEIKKSFDVFVYGPTSLAANNEKLPFKKHLFPPVQGLFRADVGSSASDTSIPPVKFVLFGLGLADLEALTYLDEIMKNPVEDFYYFQRRNRCVVVGVVNEKIDSMPGGDVILQKISADKYKVWAENEKGKQFVKKYKIFFEEPFQTIIEKEINDGAPSQNDEWSKSIRETLLNPELLSDAVEWSRHLPIWDELAKQCLGCGICTYVCPLCYCFSTEDRVALDGKCFRCRKWDACVLPEFSEIAGGHNFRKNIKERYYNWFFHKFVRAYNEYGKSQCVGCDRCKRYCPAKIDIQDILKKILEEYKKTL